MLFELTHCIIVDTLVGRVDHDVDQIERTVAELSGLHRTPAHENRRDIQTHGGHKHAGSDLVAVAYADHGVGLVGIDHILHTVSYQIARRQ